MLYNNNLLKVYKEIFCLCFVLILLKSLYRETSTQSDLLSFNYFERNGNKNLLQIFKNY